MNTRVLVALAALLISAASCERQKEAAFLVVVRVDGVVSTHVNVTAKGGSLSRTSNCMPIGSKTRLEVAVVQTDFPEAITLEAHGFTDSACATLTDPPESAGPLDVRFRANSIVDKELVLKAEVPRQETSCANGQDDDRDGKTDCADFDCNERDCSTGNLCVEGQKCQNNQCQGGTQVTCTTPPQCFTPMGVCVVDAGCRYLPGPGGDMCNDGDGCTEVDTCEASGRCTGRRKTCNSPPAGECFSSAGSCADGGCVYLGKEDAGCNDNDNCTLDDRCSPAAACSGKRVSCVPSECQLPSTGCTVDGGCVFPSIDAGTPCAGDAGVCNEQGGCIQFPYVPSNLTSVTQIPTPAGDVVLDCGETVIDTGASGVPVTTNWCAGQPKFGYAAIVQSGGVAAAVISFNKLDVRAGATLRITGVRPAIVVAHGSITVLGTIVSEAGAQACVGSGAGGNGGDSNAGGGGGAFGSAGGNGGPNGLNTAQGGSGGTVNGNAELVPVRGGCPGGKGGSRLAVGGGGLQLSAASDLVIAGTIAAPGEGGQGGGAFIDTAANGGGSGGALLLEAARVTASAGAITANGGGGGEGGGVTVDGKDGASGARASASPAAGGSSAAIGGPGGNGAAGTTPATNGAQTGGGGGGGVGRIRINVLDQCSIGPPVVISPPATSNKPDAGCP